MTLISQCSRLLAQTSSRNFAQTSRAFLPSISGWRQGGRSGGSGPKFNYSYGFVGLLGAAVCSVGVALNDGQISADELELAHGHMHWEHKEWNKSYDHKALRRGFQVYKEVCQACHSMQYFYWRMHIDVTHTKEEVKEMAAEYMYPDVDDEGNAIERQGDIQDFMPAPYDNEIKARLANNGAHPPDLTLINVAREGNEDYLFSLLTGYEDVPPGQAEPAEGQAYNPYFHGYYIGMAQQLYNESVDYEDGTIPYQSQIAKDIIQYLAWTAHPWMDEMSMYGMKAVASAAALVIISYIAMRTRRNGIRSRQIHFTVPGHDKSITKNGVVNNFTKYKEVDDSIAKMKR
ncbi:uncharacterized protein LOC134815234 [Bolinopsis microptera]|uniref:uncharacterized protein LOC134815234 n=1 Tax=Bolinopsis microptera TaxID=2820187 RepID=UPI00307A199A